jgi:hypothetical protein
LKTNYQGCAICGSTWGNVWAEVEGQRLFFCCDICRIQFSGLIERIKQETGWARLDAVEIAGDRRGRSCVATSGSESARFDFVFNSEGMLRHFARQDATRRVTPGTP